MEKKIIYTWEEAGAGYFNVVRVEIDPVSRKMESVHLEEVQSEDVAKLLAEAYEKKAVVA